MPLHQVDIEKEYRGEYWTNRYIIQVADVDAGMIVAQNIVLYERSAHLAVVNFHRVRVSDMVQGTDLYRVEPLNTQGTLAVDASGWLPLWNVVRVDFGVATGRPSRKYLRCPIQESWTVEDSLTPGHIAILRDGYVANMVALPEYVDVDGQPIINGAVIPKVAMRQLRRGSRRRTLPVL